jgi:hypothetical protein
LVDIDGIETLIDTEANRTRLRRATDASGLASTHSATAVGNLLFIVSTSGSISVSGITISQGGTSAGTESATTDSDARVITLAGVPVPGETAELGEKWTLSFDGINKEVIVTAHGLADVAAALAAWLTRTLALPACHCRRRNRCLGQTGADFGTAPTLVVTPFNAINEQFLATVTLSAPVGHA